MIMCSCEAEKGIDKSCFTELSDLITLVENRISASVSNKYTKSPREEYEGNPPVIGWAPIPPRWAHSEVPSGSSGLHQ